MLAAHGNCWVTVNSIIRTESRRALCEQCLEITSAVSRVYVNQNRLDFTTSVMKQGVMGYVVADKTSPSRLSVVIQTHTLMHLMGHTMLC